MLVYMESINHTIYLLFIMNFKINFITFKDKHYYFESIK